MTVKRILIFTDSRGQHKPAGSNHKMFAERLGEDARFSVDMFLCPMKWTTILDFIENFPPEKLLNYDHIILYAGIVDWSPRSVISARTDLYNGLVAKNIDNLKLNTRDYSKKIINNKKYIFDYIFGLMMMENHFSKPFDTMYEGQNTINMYSLDMASKRLIPLLAKIPNLIFINSNRFVPGWEGDFKRGRPANINITHNYSDFFATELSRAGVKLIDLRSWDNDEVKIHTCDNLHLTKSGSDWIYNELMKIMNVSIISQNVSTSFSTSMVNYDLISNWGTITFQPFKEIERITSEKRQNLTSRLGRGSKKLATLIIGLQLQSADSSRIENLKFLLKWIDHYYLDLFDVLIVEQGDKPKLNLNDIDAKTYVRYEFIFNNNDYNRGWGYNTSVRHFCKESEVVVLMDTDVLPGAGFVSGVLSCYENKDVCSPYINIYYTTESEVREISEKNHLTCLNNESHIKNPVTICGGIVIFRREVYLSLNGFEQYIGYGCEDRALDVTIMNHLDSSRIKIIPETYVHLYHPSDQGARSNFKEIYNHLRENYNCSYHGKISHFEFIHKLCNHSPKEKTLTMVSKRSHSFGDLDLYRSGAQLTINGQRKGISSVSHNEDKNYIFPPAFTTLDEYEKRELYSGTQPPDSAELSEFYNRYKGERCFVIGNGPSLNRHDLSLLAGEYSFGVNSFYYKTRETGFIPTFYVVEDSSVMKENISEITSFNAQFKFFPTIYRHLHPKTSNTLFFEMNRGFYEKSSPNYVVPRFSTDASKVVYCGQSVTYINLQIAFFMGFTEVHLIGMDFDYIIPETHKRTGDVLLSDTDDLNHFHKDYFGKGKTWKDPKLDRVGLNYRQAKLVYESVGRKIYNTTIGGNLEIFERMDYEKLLRDPITGGKLHKQTSDIDQRFSKKKSNTISIKFDPLLTSLQVLCARLLLDPEDGLYQLSRSAELQKAVTKLKNEYTEEYPLRQNFEKTLRFAQRKVMLTQP